jgi:hypothetical protein
MEEFSQVLVGPWKSHRWEQPSGPHLQRSPSAITVQRTLPWLLVIALWESIHFVQSSL